MTIFVKVKTLTFLFLPVFVMACILPAAWAGTVSVTTSPGIIDVGLGFRGAKMDISGKVPAGSDIYLKITSQPRSEKLNKKGKVGILWMNVSHAEVEDIPKMYQIYTSASIEKLPISLQEKTGIDKNYNAVRSRVRIVETAGEETKELSPQKNGAEFVNTLINSYQKEGLYTIKEGVLTTGGGNFHISLPLPAEVAQGKNSVTVYAVKEGQLVGQSETSFEVRPVGLVGWCRSMAKTNGPLYGTYAVFIALMAGIAIDILFGYAERSILAILGVRPKTAKSRDLSAEAH